MKFIKVFAWIYPSYLQMNVAAIGAAAAVGGAAISANASGKASNAQTAAANQANALQQYQFDQTRADNAPFLKTGTAANNELAMRLGIAGGTNKASLAESPLSSGTSYNSQLYNSNEAYRKAWDEVAGIHYAAYGKGYQADSDMSWVDQQVRARLGGAYEAEKIAQAEQDAKNALDPKYGSLLKAYGKDEADNDYIYQTQKQFGLDQGVNALNRQAAASGSMLSGAAAKALTRFGNDYAGQKLGESYNRYQNDQSNIFNRLSGISGTGQQAVNQVSTAGQNYANQVGNNLTSLGNARGASAISGANSFNNALSQGTNFYQNQQLINSLGNRSQYGGSYFPEGATNQTSNFDYYGSGYSP